MTVHFLILCNIFKVAAVICLVALCHFKHLLFRYPAIAEGNFLNAGNVHALSFLNRSDKIASFQKPVVSSGVQLGHSSAKKLHVQLLAGKILVIHAGDFDFAPGRRLYAGRDIHDLVGIEIKPGYGII